MSTPREQVKVFFFFWSKPNHAFNTTLNKSYVHFFEYIKSNCAQILKNLQITIMNLWLQINELLTNLFSFFPYFFFLKKLCCGTAHFNIGDSIEGTKIEHKTSYSDSMSNY